LGKGNRSSSKDLLVFLLQGSQILGHREAREGIIQVNILVLHIHHHPPYSSTQNEILLYLPRRILAIVKNSRRGNQ